MYMLYYYNSKSANQYEGEAPNVIGSIKVSD